MTSNTPINLCNGPMPTHESSQMLVLLNFTTQTVSINTIKLFYENENMNRKFAATQSRYKTVINSVG